MFHVKHSDLRPSILEYLDSLALGQRAEEAVSRLESFAEVLLKQASRRNLVSASQRNPEAVWSHILDSLQSLSLPSIRTAPILIDAGSGAGLPGIPLALARPDATVWLVERSSAKAEFLELARALVPVMNIEVQSKELKALSSAAPVLARALVQPEAWPALVRGSRLTGSWIVYSTENNRKDWERAAKECDFAIKSAHEYNLPGKSAIRTILEFSRK